MCIKSITGNWKIVQWFFLYKDLFSVRKRRKLYVQTCSGKRLLIFYPPFKYYYIILMLLWFGKVKGIQPSSLAIAIFTCKSWGVTFFIIDLAIHLHFIQVCSSWSGLLLDYWTKKWRTNQGLSLWLPSKAQNSTLEDLIYRPTDPGFIHSSTEFTHLRSKGNWH